MSFSRSFSSDYDTCMQRSFSNALPFDPNALENLILSLCDKFNVRVIKEENESVSPGAALLVTAGLAVFGGLIGKHYGGNLGAVVGGAVGGACGVGLVGVSMREIWHDIKNKLWELFDIVYDYIAGLGIEDYVMAALTFTQYNNDTARLVSMIVKATAKILDKTVVSSLTSALAQ